jgi:alpha-amylase/alpha-mannosidase (GH57 family)
MPEPRYVIIHGHFYQPPRESPWTGLISPEPGAAPFPNWNEKILSECYIANGRAHIMDGRVAHIRNNYAALNFDFGPTLISWLERHGAHAYRAIRHGDQQSVAERGGHGNAIAQSYNHSILPLLRPRDRALQIAWGIEDFVARFKRRPEGMWLPECAADHDTLRDVAAAGMKFIILAPEQGTFHGERAGRRGAGPFIWRSESLCLAVFRFDRDLSRAVSFGDGLKDGRELANSIAEAAAQVEPGGVVMIATDGETFGHHKRHGDGELARAIDALELREDVRLTNCAEYLALFPGGAGSFEIGAPSSWSCPHGVERWRAACGCRMDSATHQDWRGPLREAMDFVNNHASAVYERFAPPLVDDAAAALLESIRLAIDANPALAEEFFVRHRVNSEASRESLMRLFEMERGAQAALTSCAWFFDDFGGPEGRVVLRWAARAVELAAEFALSVEPELLERLRQIRSNRREIGDAATLYLSLKTREARGRV